MSLTSRYNRLMPLYFGVVVVALAAIVGSLHMTTGLPRRTGVEPVDVDSLQRCVRRLGYQGTVSAIELNGNATALLLHGLMSRAGKRVVLKLDRSGAIHHIDTKAYRVYLNARNNMVAWFEEPRPCVTFWDGTKYPHVRIGTFSMDPTASFFAFESSGNTVSIAQTSQPGTILARTKMSLDSIFFRESRVFLMARELKGQLSEDRTEDAIILAIYEKSGEGLELVDEVRIVRPSPGASPFFVADMNSDATALLLKEIYDPPATPWSPWYVYHISTRSLARVGRSWHDHAFFLNWDVGDAVKNARVTQTSVVQSASYGRSQ